MDARKVIVTCTHTERNPSGIVSCGFEYKQRLDKHVVPDLFPKDGTIRFRIIASDAEMIEMLGKDFEITLSPVGS